MKVNRRFHKRLQTRIQNHRANRPIFPRRNLRTRDPSWATAQRAKNRLYSNPWRDERWPIWSVPFAKRCCSTVADSVAISSKPWSPCEHTVVRRATNFHDLVAQSATSRARASGISCDTWRPNTRRWWNCIIVRIAGVLTKIWALWRSMKSDATSEREDINEHGKSCGVHTLALYAIWNVCSNIVSLDSGTSQVMVIMILEERKTSSNAWYDENSCTVLCRLP